MNKLEYILPILPLAILLILSLSMNKVCQDLLRAISLENFAFPTLLFAPKKLKLLYHGEMLRKLIRLFKPPKFQRPRKIILRKEGVHFHLDEIYTKVNQTYFDGKLNLHITWFNPKKTRYQRRIVLGSYHRDKNLVKINRVLDQADIPEYYISFIVYHEMLHHVAPPIVEKFRKRQIHHPEFKDLEKKFHDYALVKEFRKKSKMRWFVD